MKSGSAKWIEVLRVDKNPVKSSYVHMFIIVYPYFCWLDPIQSPFFIGKSHEITIFAGFSIPFPSLFALPSGYVDITEDTDAQLMGIVDEEKERLAPWPQNHVVMSCQVRSGHVCVYIYIICITYIVCIYIYMYRRYREMGCWPISWGSDRFNFELSRIRSWNVLNRSSNTWYFLNPLVK